MPLVFVTGVRCARASRETCLRLTVWTTTAVDRKPSRECVPAVRDSIVLAPGVRFPTSGLRLPAPGRLVSNTAPVHHLSGHHHCGRRRRADRAKYGSWRCTAPSCLPGLKQPLLCFLDKWSSLFFSRAPLKTALRSPFARVPATIHVQCFTRGERGVAQKQSCVDDFFDLTDPAEL